MVLSKRIIRLANKIIESSLEALNKDKTMFITDSAYTIRDLLKNKPKFYRILYDTNINRWLIGEGTYTIHTDLINNATSLSWYPDLIDSYNSIIDYFQDGLIDGELEAYSFAPKTMNVDKDRYEDNYAFKLVYDFGNLYVNNYVYWQDCELVKILGKPNKIVLLEELFGDI